MQITITKPRLMYAAALCVSTEASRYYLHGVFIQPHRDGGAYIVATDGHRMSIGYDPDATLDGVPPSGVILNVPKAAVAKLKAAKVNDVATWSSDDSILRINPDFACLCPEIDGTFPDWMRICPKIAHLGDAAPGATFNGKYIADFALVSKALSDRYAALTLIGAGELEPHWVLAGDPNWRGVLMPLRGNGANPRPDWI